MATEISKLLYLKDDGYKLYYSVLTMKHGKTESLITLMNRLLKYRDEFLKKIKYYKKYDKTPLANIEGLYLTIEITYKTKTGWHPHINIFFITRGNDNIENELIKLWQQITNNKENRNYIKEIDFNENDIVKIVKYMLKIEIYDIPYNRQVEYFEYMEHKKKNLVNRIGLMKNQKIKELEDTYNYWQEEEVFIN